MENTTPVLFEPTPGYVLDQDKALLALSDLVSWYGKNTAVKGLFALSQIHVLLLNDGNEVQEDLTMFLYLLGNLMHDLNEAAVMGTNQQIANSNQQVASLEEELKEAKKMISQLVKRPGIIETKKFFPN